MRDRSDSIEGILTALDIASFKRRIMEKYEGVTKIRVAANNQSVYMRNVLPGDRVVDGTVPLNGQPFEYTDRETGRWVTSATYTNHRLVQMRKGPLGTMYDVRVVLSHDLEGLVAGPVMLFRWTFIPFRSPSRRYSAMRWLHKIGFF